MFQISKIWRRKVEKGKWIQSQAKRGREETWTGHDETIVGKSTYTS